MLKNENFYSIHGWMRNELHLSGNELQIYAVIYGFSQKDGQVYDGSIRYLSESVGASYNTVLACLQSLVKKGLLTRKKTENGRILYRAVVPHWNMTEQEYWSKDAIKEAPTEEEIKAFYERFRKE